MLYSRRTLLLYSIALLFWGDYMSRPRKWRRVRGLPANRRFGPLDPRPHHEESVIMTVEEHETLRLIDLEGMNQEECAMQMDVARTTAQGIYYEARKKLADALINGKILIIEGGNYRLHDEEPTEPGEGFHRHRVGKGKQKGYAD